MQVTVISAGKKEQALVDTAAAVYVITQEEIRRSGVTSVPCHERGDQHHH